jgi:hypothetical protein
MLMKFVKPNSAKKAVFKSLPNLIGAVYFFGKIGCLDENTKIQIINENGELEFKKIKDV